MAFVDLEDFLGRARLRLDPVEGEERLSEGGDIEFLDADGIANIRRAAVLVPIIPRPAGPVTLLTHRPQTMKTHAGQVAFPGGKVDPVDADEIEAALREAQEEVGVDPDNVDLIARGAPYITGTGFRIVPVVGVLPADFVPQPDPVEVDSVFETPLSFLMKAANHQRQQTRWKGQLRHYYEMPYEGHRIWGVTAGIIRGLYERLYEAGEEAA
ncbi:MAG: CoA pyrophosphatase [Henriciella sp.]|jgi:8-oxo-dGTP pyrophosphatase MutT (NUDIX family)|uniref:CoA pyrophosphatase n=1 Tax=Henriciella sp. TaxID=1968823 RepID=UPI000C0F36EC|nr:CoA pyrophosphatase [Henriciella sp.]MAN73234.1 CoA pyrophosphatase [Henriciella sp.]MBF34572.1 CoA pyrophosphatase [Hyphomonadaceae bacterium]PHR74939.1 MAG: CoA pyrophosphatase [Henriciella sp.]|tara:strand:+ start:2130 stop:2765 length:636 start_codon:yes stop_codon:yes gene_type:complete